MDRKRVLIVAGPAFFGELEETFLKRQDIELLTADGTQAQVMATAYRPELVIIEAEVPGLSGDECCRRIKDNSDAAVPVVLIAAGDDPAVLARCREAGCDELLTRPVDLEHLSAISSRYLGLTERAAPRIEARLRVRYGLAHRQLLSDYSVNLSTGGLFLETDDPLPLETPLDLEFLLPDLERTIRCRGRVAWHNRPQNIVKESLPVGMGVQFIDLTLEDMDALRDFVKRKLVAPSW
jgi:uncharacterized protein (TIGR02266 family)